MTPIIALLTDFGTDDIYVGVMKGVMQGICPDAKFIDITHAISPQHVRQAAFNLMNAYTYFPKGSVFLLVVDPGVGSKRLPIAVKARDYTFIAPDNGLLSYTLTQFEGYQAVHLENKAYQLQNISQSFHGRDIFAPAAAHLAAGVHLNAFGESLEKIVQLPLPELSFSGHKIDGEVMDIDRFGNIITSIGRLEWLSPERLMFEAAFGADLPSVPVVPDEALITIHDTQVFSINTSYSEAVRGEVLAMVGSTGYLEIAVNQGNAAQRLDAVIGDRVELQIGDANAAIHH